MNRIKIEKLRKIIKKKDYIVWNGINKWNKKSRRNRNE